MALSVVADQVCSVMPGALVAAVRGYRELEALPLESPQLRTPIGFMRHAQARASRAMEAALALAKTAIGCAMRPPIAACWRFNFPHCATAFMY